jgi:AsmA protein
LFFILLVVFLPPLVNVSRFQQRIASNISSALGRPVHFDRVSLTLLPLPGFTLQNFVVDEDPAFGYEPILRAGEVRATLRISSIWHRRVEFSKIALRAGDAEIAPSVNLVRAASGQWNIETLLLQASHIQAAPTSQRFAGAARRFPYIEATGARLNLKIGQEKSPYSLTDADFALWLPEPHQWHLRLEAHPLRTDTSPGDTGTIRAEGILGDAAINALSIEQIPIDLHGDWREAQLGGLSRLILGHDTGLRGDFSLSFAIRGTIDHNTITTNIKLAKARRAAFVPNHMLSLEAACSAASANTFRSFPSIECHWPPADSSDLSILILTASLPDVRRPRNATASLTLPALPADTLFDWLRVATPQPPAVLAGSGTLAATLAWGPSTESFTAPQLRRLSTQPALPGEPSLTGEVEFSGGSLATGPAGNQPLPLGDMVIRSTPVSSSQTPRARARRPAVAPAPSSFDLLPIPLALGGKQPATLDGHFDANGYTLHLTGTVVPARLLALGSAVPQFGDGLHALLDNIASIAPLAAKPGPTTSAASTDSTPAPDTDAGFLLTPAPIRVDLTATRHWGGPQTWTQTALSSPSHRRSLLRRSRHSSEAR